MCAKNLFSIESRLISTIGPAMEKITVSSSWKLIYIFAPIRLYSGRLVKRKPKCAWVEFVTLLATAAKSVTRIKYRSRELGLVNRTTCQTKESLESWRKKKPPNLYEWGVCGRDGWRAGIFENGARRMRNSDRRWRANNTQHDTPAALHVMISLNKKVTTKWASWWLSYSLVYTLHAVVIIFASG